MCNRLSAIFRVSLFLLISLHAHALSNEEAKEKIIGEWQIGLSVYTKGMPFQTAIRTGQLGPIWRFNSDNTLEVYLPCDVSVPIDGKATTINKGEINVAGRWQLQNDGVLLITLSDTNNPSKKIEEVGELQFDQYPSVKLGAGTMTIKVGKDKNRQFGRFKEAESNCTN